MEETYWQRARRIRREALVDLSFEHGYYLSTSGGGKKIRITVDFEESLKPAERGYRAEWTAEAVMYLGYWKLGKALRKFQQAAATHTAMQSLKERASGLKLSLMRSEAFVAVMNLCGDDSPYMAKVAAAESVKELTSILIEAKERKEEEGLDTTALSELRAARERKAAQARELAAIEAQYARWR